MKLSQRHLNYIFVGGVVLCFLFSFVIELYDGPNTIASYVDNNHAYDDSTNLLFAIFLFLPFAVSRFFLRNSGISLIEVFYFPGALYGAVMMTEMDSGLPLSVSVPSTFQFGSVVNAICLSVYLSSFLAMIFSYFVLTARQAKALWAMYTE